MKIGKTKVKVEYMITLDRVITVFGNEIDYNKRFNYLSVFCGTEQVARIELDRYKIEYFYSFNNDEGKLVKSYNLYKKEKQ